MPGTGRAVGLLAVLILLLFGGTPVTAQQPGEVIRDIVVEGNQRVEKETVESYLRVRRGDPFDPVRLDDSLRSLFATGLFDDVAIERRGEVLVVRVVENPIINRVAFEGNRRIGDEELEAEVRLRPRTVFSRAAVQSAVERILELYRRNGRYAVTVEPKIIELEQNRVDLVFEIQEGPLTRVCGITFIGNSEYADSTLRGTIRTVESAWYRIFTSEDTYDPDRVEFDKELLRRFYQARGYAEFKVLSAVAELTPDGRCFYITFTLEEGPRYRFGRITVDSRLRDLDPEQLLAFVATEEGDLYNAEEIENTVQALTDEVGRLGYAFARIEPVQNLDRENLTVDVTYRIDQGPRVYVERIDIRGNVRTLDSVIRREFRLAEGDPFNTVLLRRSIQRIRNLDFFEKVDVRTRQGSAPDRIIVDVEVAEKSTGSLSFGAGFSTVDGPLADVRLSEENLLGRGQSLLLSFTVSARRQRIEFSFTEPYFLDRDLAAGIDLARTESDFQTESSFDETLTRGRVRASYALTEYLRHSVRYTLKHSDIRDVDNDASDFIKDEQGERLTSAIGQTFTYDRRDTRFLPSEGYVIRLDQDIAGLLGDSKYVRQELKADYYFSILPEVVLNLGGAAGYVFGFAGEDVHLTERFFLGGSSFRGFAAAGIGPRDTATDDALGGNLYYVGTAEIRFPLGLPKELRVFGRAFVDAGTLTDIDVSGSDLEDSGNIRVSAGVGLSWLSPLGPLAIDIAQALVKDDEDDTETFRLSFGTRF